MRKRVLITGAAVVALAGAAIAAKPQTHVMNVPLADGTVVQVEYVGDVAPKVSIAPRRVAADTWAMPALPSFAGFDQMIERMNRETEAMIRQAQQMAGRPAPGASPYVASFGNVPAGVTSTTVVSVSNGGGTCTRTTQTVSQGPGKPPKVTTSVSGNCAASSAPAPSSAPISRT